jgi:hypothetical protein
LAASRLLCSSTTFLVAVMNLSCTPHQ